MSFITEQIARRLNKLIPECKKYTQNHRAMPIEVREDFSLMFASTFKEFQAFAELGMKFLGFDLSEVQADIAEFMQYGHKQRMVQAQRGEAKSTIAALYCVWFLIQNNSARILVVSAGSKQAEDMCLLITRIIMTWSMLCWMRPDTTMGDRSSSINFDVHYSIKGIDKSASVSCVGITSNFTGFRADLLLADDIEVPTNSETQTKRETLIERSKEFSAICTKGDILYLGTPQNKDSVYRTLPRRGFDVRVWTGRYPTNKELERYGAGVKIAPLLMTKLLENPELQLGGGLDGTRGQPTDPNHINEETLCSKELDYGEEGFTLQYMLDTTLTDELRTKIKISDFMVVGCDFEHAPEIMSWAANDKNMIAKETLKQMNPAAEDFKFYNAVGLSDTYAEIKHKCMIIDPAGSGGDEIAFTTGGVVNNYILGLSTGGFRGGTTEENVHKCYMLCLEQGLDIIDIERNMGHGTVLTVFSQYKDKLRMKCAMRDEELSKEVSQYGYTLYQLDEKLNRIGLGDYYSSGQKEKRIIDTISPITRRHKLAIRTECISEDWEHCLQHPNEKRIQYSAFYQLGNITYDRQSLVHDDRADCWQRLVERLSPLISQDEVRIQQEREDERVAELVRNPMGYTETQKQFMMNNRYRPTTKQRIRRR